MMKKFRLELKNKFKLIICLALFIISNTVVATSVYDSNGNSDIKSFYNTNNSYIDVCGDSYAGLFCDYESDHQLTLFPCYAAGKNLLENVELFGQALYSYHKIVFVSIGVNDHFNQTDPVAFENFITNFVINCLMRQKYVVFHTYMPYFVEDKVKRKFSLEIYDNILKGIAIAYSNVYYIDMSDLGHREYISSDCLHYSKVFYDNLYIRLVDTIISMKF